jgi:DNA-binding response OmpR family regulator
MATQVLLADDDVELSGMLKEYLEREGYAVTAVHDGEAAVRLAPGFQIVVLDVMMPKLDGIEALRRIRQASRVPVIMLTARGDDVDRIVGLELGADDYVPKPCTPRELAARLRAILRRPRRPRGRSASRASCSGPRSAAPSGRAVRST